MNTWSDFRRKFDRAREVYVELADGTRHMADLVVKEVHGAGGYGMLVGPASTKAEIDAFREAVAAALAGERELRSVS